MIEGLHYKLRIFGVPIDGPAKVLCDNEGVVKNASIPESVLNKKGNYINYNKVQEAAVAKNNIEIGKEDGQTNLADLFTKVIGCGYQAQDFVERHSLVMQRSQTVTQVLGYGAPRQARPVDHKYSGNDSWNRPRQWCLQASEDLGTSNTLVVIW
jgi:hypothetical protein